LTPDLCGERRVAEETNIMKPVRKAILPVGGLGTRLLPATKAVPKEMLTIVDKPLIQYAVEEASAAGLENLIFVIGPDKEAIEQHFDERVHLQDVLEEQGKDDALEAVQDSSLEPGRYAYVRQSVPLGVGHAIWCARGLIGDEPVAVLLPDDLILSETPCVKQLLDVYQKVGGNVIAVEAVPREETSRYGVIDVAGEEGAVIEAKGIVEKPAPDDAPSTLAVIGRYILQPEVFEALENQKPGAGGEIQLTDAIAQTLGSVPLHAVRFEGQRFDCGNKLGFVEANVAFALARQDLRDDVVARLQRHSLRF
jgi:UTP--glucose-1-phosphate uridylyltransferase